MENQHRKIKGYRELSQEEIDLINEVKSIGVSLEVLQDKLELVGRDESRNTSEQPSEVDTRWLSIGVTHFQQGLMAWTRAIAKPDFF